jgi:DNA processing protein
MEELRAYIWLTLRLHYNSIKISTVLSFFKSPLHVYRANADELEAISGMTRGDIEALCDKDLTKAEYVLQVCQKKQYQIIPLSSSEYPERLSNIVNPPHILYVNGDISTIDEELCIAVVGTRKPTAYGHAIAKKLGKGLATNGAVVVSGMAKGIDTEAHIGALKGQGKTIAVLGCGLDVVYPAENKELMEEIAKAGAVVTEYIPGTKPDGRNFPIRNRIISALSLGTVVVEADIKSGSLITAKHANEQGRDIFAIPGNIDSPMSEGANALIKDGAKPVTSIRDIFEEYVGILPYQVDQTAVKEWFVKQGQKEDAKQPAPSSKREIRLPKDISYDEMCIMQLLCKGSQHIDLIIRECGMEIHKINSVLMALELKGYIIQLPSKQFMINSDQNGDLVCQI